MGPHVLLAITLVGMLTLGATMSALAGAAHDGWRGAWEGFREYSLFTLVPLCIGAALAPIVYAVALMARASS